MRRKYRLSGWVKGGTYNRQAEYGIDKRFLLFWWKPLCHTKIVGRGDGENDFSYEILTFKNRFAAELEVANLNAGGEPIRRRYYLRGKMIAESRYQP